MRNLLVAAAMAALCFGQTAPPAPAAPNSAYKALLQEVKNRINHIDVEQFRALRAAHPNALVIDVRESEEWAKGHAAGAIHIPRGLLEREIEAQAPVKDAVILLYCHSGSRSAFAAESLGRMGYLRVYSLDGGLGAYESAGLPMEK